MIYNIYAIQDTMIGFNAPFIMKNDDIARREYKNFLAHNPNSEDMRLYRLGTFNDETGDLEKEIPTIIEGGSN